MGKQQLYCIVRIANRHESPQHATYSEVSS